MQTQFYYQEIDLMKKVILILVVVFAAMTMAMAQVTLNNNYSSPTDILGAHLLYGRGCIGCHAPHSGSGGNGLNPQTDPTSGNAALWGQDLTPLYNANFGFGDGGAYPVQFPANGNNLSAHDPISGIMFCLSCHDGSLARVGWMRGRTVETLPIVGGTAPTLLGNDGTTLGNYHNDHPVGQNAVIGCTGQYNWDCSIVNGAIDVASSGPFFKQFVNVNYGFTVSPAKINNAPAVTCTTCHDQHSMTVWQGTASSMPSKPGYYQTSFFVRGPYQPQTGGNNAAQFCRNCHGGEANEKHNSENVPTT
jgi:hypothetical protein